MPCDLETTLENACTSGIGKVDSELMLLVIIAQLTCELAAASGGGTGGAGSVGSGSPEGVVTATEGTVYYDLVQPALWIKTSGSGNTGWTNTMP